MGPEIPYPQKGHWTRNTLHLPRKDPVPGIPYTRPPWTDKRLWKHYLPAISLAVGNKANYGWWKSSFNWEAQSTNFWMGSIPIWSSTPPSALADLGGGVPGTRAPSLGVQILSFWCSFWKKIWKILALLGVGTPPAGKSWIRHWSVSVNGP